MPPGSIVLAYMINEIQQKYDLLLQHQQQQLLMRSIKEFMGRNTKLRNPVIALKNDRHSPWLRHIPSKFELVEQIQSKQPPGQGRSCGIYNIPGHNTRICS